MGIPVLTAFQFPPSWQQLKLERSLSSPLTAKHPEERSEGDISSPASIGTQVLPRPWEPPTSQGVYTLPPCHSQ